MTREEIQEDLRVGTSIKLKTGDGNIYSGIIDNFGETGLKISNKETHKRISYASIIEYDIVVENQSQTDGATKEDLPLNPGNMAIDKDAIIENVKKMLSKAEIGAYVSEKNRLDYARQIGEFNRTNERINKAIYNLKNLGQKNNAFYAFIGLVLLELGDRQKALQYFNASGQYCAAFKCGFPFSDPSEAEKLALYAVRNGTADETITYWLTQRAIKTDNINIISCLVQKEAPGYETAIQHWAKTHGLLDTLLPPDEAIAKLKASLISKVQDPDVQNASKPKQIQQETAITEQEGHIITYNIEKRFGLIRPHAQGQEPVFFYIAQVKDEELQRLLESELPRRYPVYYKLGINGFGKIAGDAIRLAKTFAKEDDLIISESRKGYMEMLTDNLGRVYDQENHSYNFLRKDIIDPLLLAELETSHGLREYEVTFALRKYKGKNVACNIESRKNYSADEIAHYAKLGFSRVVETAKLKNREKHIFEPEPYIALKPLVSRNNITMIKSSPTIMPSQQENKDKDRFVPVNNVPKAWPSLEQCIRKAYELVVGDMVINPFSSLEPLSGTRYYEKGHTFLVGYKNLAGDTVGKDLVKAEEFLIKAIQASDNIGSAVADLVSVYQQQDQASIIKGMQLLHEYGQTLYPSEKHLNLLVNLVDKSENDDARIYILMAAISTQTRANTLVQYKSRLASIYLNRKMYTEALSQLDECRTLISKNMAVFPNPGPITGYILKQMAIIQWVLRNTKEAVALAKASLKFIQEDENLTGIINGTYEPDSVFVLEKLDEESFIGFSDTGITKFLVNRMNKIELTSILGRFKEISGKIKEGKYIGTPEEARKAAKDIHQYIFGRAFKTKGWGSEPRSNVLLALARIISDANGGENIPSTSRAFLGRGARYLADSWVNKEIKIDSIRFAYIQALNHMEEGDETNILIAQNMLVASFFMPDSKLSNELQNLVSEVRNKESFIKEEYFRLGCKSVKDLLIATFKLKSSKSTRCILDSIYNNPSLQLEAEKHIANIIRLPVSAESPQIFRQGWENAKKQFDKYIKKLEAEIKGVVKEASMAEGLRRHTQTIKELASQKLLWSLDEDYMKDFSGLLEKIADILECYKTDDKIAGYREITIDIANQMENIEQLPTALGYDTVLPALSRIETLIHQQLEDVYQSSIPVCTIIMSNDSVFVNERITNIVISIRNEENKQTADAIHIELEFDNGIKLLERNTINSVRGGEQQELVVKIELNDEVLAMKQFEFVLRYSYEYMQGGEKKKSSVFEETMTANLLDKESFVPVINKYDRIFRGSGANKTNKELFKGRDELIESICNSLSASDGSMTRNRGIILWGQRRVGKNSVKDLLKDTIRNAYPNAYIIIELGSIGKCNTVDDFLQIIVDRTEWEIMNNYPDLYEQIIEAGVDFNVNEIEGLRAMSAFSKFMDRFSSTLQKLSPPETNIPLYCIDEFSYLYEWIEKGEIDGVKFMRFWKSFIQDYNICSLIIAQDNIPVWKSQFENEFACMNYDNEITYLDEKGAVDLIRQPCRRDNTELFDQDAVKLIYNLTLGSAFLIVILCKHIIDYLNRHYFETATRSIVRAVLEEGLMGGLNSIFNKGDFEPQILDTVYVGEKGEQIGRSNEKLLREIAEKSIFSPWVNKKELRFFEEEDSEYANGIFNRLKERNIIKIEYRDSNVYCSVLLPLLKLALLKESGKLTKDVIKNIAR